VKKWLGQLTKDDVSGESGSCTRQKTTRLDGDLVHETDSIQLTEYFRARDAFDAVVSTLRPASRRGDRGRAVDEAEHWGGEQAARGANRRRQDMASGAPDSIGSG
jgi:hypothetical protein